MTGGSESARDDRAHWEARYSERGSEPDRVASAWVIDRCRTLPPGAITLDLAGGAGRHAEALARSGQVVIVIDFVPAAVAAAVERHKRISGVVGDVRAMPLRAQSFDAIVCVSFLDRSIFATLIELLVPGGLLVYETFTLAHLDVVARGAARGPRNPDYLLAPGELRQLVAPLEVQQHEERLVVDQAGERHVARVMAVKR
jgi:SAM-dependent methyltransferase